MAIGAPVGATTAEAFTADGRAAYPAGLASSAIHPGLTTVVAVNAFKISEVAEGCSSSTDAHSEDLREAVA